MNIQVPKTSPIDMPFKLKALRKIKNALERVEASP